MKLICKSKKRMKTWYRIDFHVDVSSDKHTGIPRMNYAIEFDNNFLQLSNVDKKRGH